MKDYANTTPHVGPPDSEGWWVVQIPTRDPYLLLVANGEIPDVSVVWQDSFKCWALGDLTDVPRLPEVLSGITDRPKLLWELSHAFHQLHLAGPWGEGEDGLGAFLGRPKVGGGDPTKGATYHALVRTKTVGDDDDEVIYYCHVQGTERDGDTKQGAMDAADKILRGRGFFLIDP